MEAAADLMPDCLIRGSLTAQHIEQSKDLRMHELKIWIRVTEFQLNTIRIPFFADDTGCRWSPEDRDQWHRSRFESGSLEV